MPVSKALSDAVQHVLNVQARRGQTTKAQAAILVMGRIDKAGGPTRFGIGAAAMRIALAHIVEGEITRQLKLCLTDHDYKFVLPASTPMEIIAALGRAPRWIAINDGIDAIWKFSLQAVPDDWLANAALKEKKARETQHKARESSDIARFLVMNKFDCLADALNGGI